MGDAARWDAKHGAAEGGPQTADPFVVRALEQLGPGTGRRALDLAAGRGRHALELAARGWSVEAWDLSPVALDGIAAAARERELAVETREFDLEGPLPAGERADLVLVVNYLDRGLLERTRQLLAEGGHLLFTTFTTERTGEHPSARFCLDPGELAAGIAGFETRHHEEGGGRAGILARRER